MMRKRSRRAFLPVGFGVFFVAAAAFIGEVRAQEPDKGTDGVLSLPLARIIHTGLFFTTSLWVKLWL